MSYLILNNLVIKEKKGEIYFNGDWNNVVPRENLRHEIEGENFEEKILNLSRKILSGMLHIGNLSKNMINFQYAFIKAKEEIGLESITDYWNANMEKQNEIEKSFSKYFLKYYNEKEKKGKFNIIYNNNIKKYALKINKFLPKKFSLSDYDYIGLENLKYYCKKYENSLIFNYKKAFVLQKFLLQNTTIEEIPNNYKNISNF